jgi:hypothetical protein
MNRDNIIDAYLFLRENNHSIPSEVLDFMKEASLSEFDGKTASMQEEIDRLRVESKEYLDSYLEVARNLKILSDSNTSDLLKLGQLQAEVEALKEDLRLQLERQNKLAHWIDELNPLPDSKLFDCFEIASTAEDYLSETSIAILEPPKAED